MGRRTSRALCAVALAVGTGMASVLVAAPASAAATDTIGAWEMNEPPGSTTAFDSTGRGQHGVVGPDVQTGVRETGGTVYRWPTWYSTAPNHTVAVPHNPSLNPDTRDYAISVRLRTARYFSNVVQKGQATSPGGYWKIEITQGHAKCLFSSGPGAARSVEAGFRIDDSRWHTIRCGRSGSKVTLYVDGKLVGSRSGFSGAVSNTWDIVIGGKSRCNGGTVDCDLYAGVIDYVRVQKG